MDAALNLFAALADPTRLRIFLLVRHMQLAMGELADILGQSQPRVSRHVRLLAEAGLVRRRKEGAWVFVGVEESAPLAELDQLIDALRKGTDLIAAERTHLAQVRAGRQRALDAWFAEKAGEWDCLSRLGGQDAAVQAALAQAAREPAVGRLLDIGTGTGMVLELLAADAVRAVGVDRSPEMLRLARAKLAADGLQTAELVHADMASLPFDDHSFDTITLSQVLHFSDDPQAIVAEAARVLAPGGKLLVVEYGPHNQEELRARFHHARLGFAPETVLEWLRAVGLKAQLVAEHPGARLDVHISCGHKPPAVAQAG